MAPAVALDMGGFGTVRHPTINVAMLPVVIARVTAPAHVILPPLSPKHNEAHDFRFVLGSEARQIDPRPTMSHPPIP